MDTISFAEGFDNGEYLLFEFEEEELQKILDEQVSCEIVSNKRDPVVFCTANKTFELLEFDTSNTILINDGPIIVASASSTFELRDAPPPILSLRNFLSHYLTEEEIAGAPIDNPISYDYLVDNILTSREELDQMLVDLCAINIDGIIKVPLPETKNKIIGQIYRYSQTLSDWRKIDIDKLIDKLDLTHLMKGSDNETAKSNPNVTNLLKAVLRTISSSYDENSALLDDEKIVKFIAEGILKQNGGRMHREDFITEMDGAIPSDIKFAFEYVNGIIYTNDDYVNYVDERELPITIEERFEALFAMQRKWNQSEIEPLFKPFETRKLKFIELASRYVRNVGELWMPR